MTSARRIGAPDAKNRGVLLDAAEQLMLEEGYAAVTSRRVAEKAALKPQLVHYYFRTMDDLFLAAFRRRAEEGLEAQARVLQARQPLWALWRFSIDPAATAITMEFIALANHRKALKAEIAYYAERFREEQQKALSAVLERYGAEEMIAVTAQQNATMEQKGVKIVQFPPEVASKLPVLTTPDSAVNKLKRLLKA